MYIYIYIYPCLNEADVNSQLLPIQDGISGIGGGIAVLRLARLQPRRVPAAEEFREPLLPPEAANGRVVALVTRHFGTL